MRYYILSGEPSGDMHGADLIREIQKLDEKADFWAAGGLAMEKAMDKSCALYTATTATIGLDFLGNVYKLWKWLIFCKKDLLSYQPDAVILIDFGGFNMRLASFARKNGFPVYYYIPPKIWAYRKPRIMPMQQNVTHIFSVLPFEVSCYQTLGYLPIVYVGNPLVQKVAEHPIEHAFRTIHGLDQRPIIALLPGSRIDEIKRILPIMATQLKYFPDYQFIVSGLSQIAKDLYAKILPAHMVIVYDQTYDLLAHAKVAIVASGTATLEVALWNIPQIVVYKTSWLTYALYKKILAISYISLVNLLLNQAAVPELIQSQCTQEKLYAALKQLLREEVFERQQCFYKVIKQLLGTKETAKEVAQRVVGVSDQKIMI